ncbi:hypothetical protein [Variovorax sp. N23]|jgi:hypothetical protein|uniref:hypothetical protein n=1 Tax=Variovorax sp. N23 TaxID=2980555 RepID=UPI0021C97146|nr:hypothetical protein [Variovorax sp. N23]MCU4117754.1 hypothetical protein [Variovorax sp. N23]
MTAARPPRPSAPPPITDTEDVDDDLSADGFDSADADDADSEGPDLLAEETGIDLTDASELDADNVPADEEHDRVFQAPD